MGNLILNRLKGDIAARCGKLSGHLPLPEPQVLRHATRMTVAAVLAFAAAWAFALPEGYWLVITVVIMQGSLGGTLGASLDRLPATVAGAMVGAACVFLRGLDVAHVRQIIERSDANCPVNSPDLHIGYVSDPPLTTTIAFAQAHTMIKIDVRKSKIDVRKAAEP